MPPSSSSRCERGPRDDVWDCLQEALEEGDPAALDAGFFQTLKSIADAWAMSFCGNKLIIMTGLLKEKGKNAIIKMLNRGKEEGIDLEWDGGSVKHSVMDLGEEDSYYPEKYEFAEVTKVETSLVLFRHGKIEMSEDEELIPPEFYDDKSPIKTTFDKYDGTIEAEEVFADERAIVVWPKSRGLEVFDGNGIVTVCHHLTVNPSSRRTRMLGNRIINNYDHHENREKIIDSFLRVLVRLNDKELAIDFWKRYIVKCRGAPIEVLPCLGLILANFNQNDQIRTSLLGIIKDTSLQFVVECHRQLGDPFNSICPELTERLVSQMGLAIEDDSKWTSTVHGKSVKLLLQLALEHQYKDLSVAFLGVAIRSSLTGGEGPTNLIKASLPRLCHTFGWLHYEKVLSFAIDKLVEFGSIGPAAALVIELSYPLSYQSGNHPDQAKVCSVLTKRVVTGVVDETDLHPHGWVDLFCLTQEFCPSQFSDLVGTVSKQNIDGLTRLARMLAKFMTTAEGKEALSAVLSHCIAVVKSTLSDAPFDVDSFAIDLPDQMARFGSKGVNVFLLNPCKQSYSFQLCKSDHKVHLKHLEPLISCQEVSAGPYRPGGSGPFYFKIDKLKSRRVAAASLPVRCCLHNGQDLVQESYIRKMSPDGCNTKAVQEALKKRTKHESTLRKLETALRECGAVGAKRRSTVLTCDSQSVKRTKTEETSSEEAHSKTSEVVQAKETS